MISVKLEPYQDPKPSGNKLNMFHLMLIIVVLFLIGYFIVGYYSLQQRGKETNNKAISTKVELTQCKRDLEKLQNSEEDREMWLKYCHSQLVRCERK